MKFEKLIFKATFQIQPADIPHYQLSLDYALVLIVKEACVSWPKFNRNAK